MVCLLAAAGIGFSAWHPEHWLRGVSVVAVAMMVAAALRGTLSDTRAGMLAVRRRGFDVLCYLVLAAVIVGVGVVLPA